ncbi:MAG: DUF1156 domain-containing protein [Candidatus Hodarchaeota archaeon]
MVSKHSAREKSIRHGHPSTLHLWWARRPLAACRAMLLALLLPDPCDEHCPVDFREKARQLLTKTEGTIGSEDQDLQKALLHFIGDFANWDLSTHPIYLEVSRGLVKAAHPEETPLVVDPFAGGGSIPLEALRLGCDTFASDLNPVACLILKVMLEDIPRHGPELAEELRRVGGEIKKKAEKELAEFYPTDPDRAKPIVYLWARTVQCEAPNCGAEIPVFRSGWLSKKGATRAKFFKESEDGASTALLVDKSPRGGPITFRIVHGHGSETEKPGYRLVVGTKAPGRTANVVCPCCNSVLPGMKKNNRTAFQLSKQNGGADTLFNSHGQRVGGAYLLAVGVSRKSGSGMTYRLASDWDYEAVRQAQEAIAKISGQSSTQMSAIPNEVLPLMSGTFNVPIYGVVQWGQMFSARQKLALHWLGQQVGSIKDSILREVFGTVLGRCADYWSSGTLWAQSGEFIAHTFGRQALPMIWDFAEACPVGDASGNLDGAIDWVARVVEAWPTSASGTAHSQQEDARECPLPDQSAATWFTDPPYYFAVPYADLSDYFFVWLKRALPAHPLMRDRFDAENPLTPKEREICEMAHWDMARYAHKDKSFFENGMKAAFKEGRRVLTNDGLGCVVFAHKTTEGWEALLSGMTQGGWTITGSWPIATERPGRLRSQESAALATSVHLVCRPRTEDRTGDWAEVLRQLPNRVGNWMERLQDEGVRGADLVFACIGPALEIYSKYSKVEDAEGREIPLGGNPEAVEPHERGFLAYVWETVGRIALEHVLGTAEARARNGAAGAVEEDARLTALFLWTLQSTNGQNGNNQQPQAKEDADEEEAPKRKKKGFSLIFDVVRRFAQPLGIHLPEWEGRIIETKKGIVRLISVSERAKQLFGEAGASAIADRLEEQREISPQLTLFPDMQEATAPKIKGRRRKVRSIVSDQDLQSQREATTLDRVHAAMLLQASGRANALRALIKAEQQRGPDFLRLSNALSALYPKGSEEKRLVDAMLLAVPR